MKAKQARVATRKSTTVWITDVRSSESQENIFRRAQIKDASSSGFLLIVDRKDILEPSLRTTLTLDGLKGHGLLFQLQGMNTPLEGTVHRSRSIGKGVFELGVDWRHDAPDYWREILVDLLPGEDGEF